MSMPLDRNPFRYQIFCIHDDERNSKNKMQRVYKNRMSLFDDLVDYLNCDESGAILKLN